MYIRLYKRNWDNCLKWPFVLADKKFYIPVLKKNSAQITRANKLSATTQDLHVPSLSFFSSSFVQPSVVTFQYQTQNWKLVHSGMDFLKLKRNGSSKIDGDYAGIFEESENIWKGRDALKLSRYWCKNSTWSFVAERPGKEFKNMADKTVVKRRRRGRFREYRRHNLILIYFQLRGDEKRTSKNW